MKFETPATLGARILLWVAVFVIVGLLVFGAKTWYDKTRDAKRQLASFEGVTATVTHVNAAQAEASKASDSVAQHTSEVRTVYITRYEELKREDPTLAAYLDSCVPIKLRRLACERRAALRGLGDSESGCIRFDDKEECAR